MSPNPGVPRELLLSVAQDMFIKGWQPVWCLARQSGAFTPIPGTTGGTSPWPTVEPQPAGAHRLAFRPPPSVIIFDVDHYDYKRGADTMDRAEAWLGDLPETFKVTSRGFEDPSGRYLYHKPEWLDFTDSALMQFADDHGDTHIEIVRTSHRFSWAPGDINHKNNLQVQCYAPDGDICLLPPVEELPELPERWVAYFANPPVPQALSAYTRPADGPEWWLGQADDSLGSDAELAAFAFSMMLSRVPMETIFEQWLRVSVAHDPSWQWSRADFDRHLRDQAQAKAAVQLQREDDEQAMFEGIAGGADVLQHKAEEARAQFERDQKLVALRDQRIAETVQGIGGGEQPFFPVIPLEHDAPQQEAQSQREYLKGLVRGTPEYDRSFRVGLARLQADEDVRVLLTRNFEGFRSIGDLPAPPDPATLAITGKDSKYSRVIGPCTVTVISGHRSSGKTWAVATWGAQELRAGNKLIWLDFERQDMLLNSKMRALGIQKHVLNGPQMLYSSELPPTAFLVNEIEQASQGGQHRVLLVIDAFRTLQNLVAPGTTANDGDAVEQVYIDYLTPAVEAGANVVLLDHMAKAGITTFGSERKESAADYVIRVEKIAAFSKKTPGYASLTMTKDRYGNTEEGTVVGHLWMPGDGAQSAEEGITKWPVFPELRNWAPEGEPVTLEAAGGSSEKARKEEAVLDIVRANRLQLGPRPLGTRVFETYPDLFTTAKAATDFAGRMYKDGKLTKEEGSQGKYDIPAQAPVKEVHSPGPAVEPADLLHPEEG